MYPTTQAAIHVLVVDDARGNRHLLEALLASEGYSVGSAATGKEALDQIAHRRPRLIVLDLKLPDMEGAEVMRRVREHGDDIPFLVVTGDTRHSALSAAQQADAYLLKPYDVEALLHLVGSLACGTPAASIEAIVSKS